MTNIEASQHTENVRPQSRATAALEDDLKNRAAGFVPIANGTSPSRRRDAGPADDPARTLLEIPGTCSCASQTTGRPPSVRPSVNSRSSTRPRRHDENCDDAPSIIDRTCLCSSEPHVACSPSRDMSVFAPPRTHAAETGLWISRGGYRPASASCFALVSATVVGRNVTRPITFE